MTTVIHQPADKLFKLSMQEVRVAKEFFQSHLPPHLLARMDLKTLHLEKNSYIDDAYKTTEADVLYSVKTGSTTAYLYLLCEHQSTVDRLMPFRLLGYTIRIMTTHLKQHPSTPLPLVYPMVVYSGTDPWTAPPDIFPLFGEAEALARDTLLKPYQLLDLNNTSDDELRQAELSGIVAFALKHKKTRDFNRFLEQLMPWIQRIEIQDPSGAFLARIVVQYVIHDMTEGQKDLMVEESKHYLSEELRGEIMTIAQQFRDEGEQKGIQKGMLLGRQEGMLLGRQEGMLLGRQEGMQQGEATLLIRLIKLRFGSIPSTYIDLIHQADEDTLLLWGERILDAKKLRDIFEE